MLYIAYTREYSDSILNPKELILNIDHCVVWIIEIYDS